jgi:squalene-hopene/tetraprenyl-beta-curcumene cyclase
VRIEQPETLENSNTDRFSKLNRAIDKTREYLLRSQSEEGYWVGELEADASVAAGYIPLMYYMDGRVDPAKQAKVVNYVRSKQKADGSWGSYFGSPGDLSVTIQVYFALKLAGMPATEPHMQKARDFVLAGGGLMKANTVTKIWLALFGQFDYRGIPSIPPEIALLPNWFYFNIYEFASWSRETIMALIIILNNKPVCRIPENAGVSELFVEPENKRRYVPARWGKFFSWRNFFILLDYIFKASEKQPFKPFRRRAMSKVEKWVVAHQEIDGSWGGIMLPWIYSLMALKSSGYKADHPAIKKGMQGLAPFIVEDTSMIRMQPATSPIWDTAWSILALRESGIPANHAALARAGEWLLKEEIHTDGDWKIKNPRVESGCWAFEFDNEFYPDIDDTSVVARALLNIELAPQQEAAKAEAAGRGWRWVEAMHSSDGGWAAFDRNNNKQILGEVPFADFMTPLDPTSADVTAHALELISRLDAGSLSIKRGTEYLKRIQEPDGAWYGRWGVNYIYGTGLSLVSLRSAGEDMGQGYIGRALQWLTSHQNQDGGWGETCETYVNPAARGKGQSAASQTAWALMGLIAAGNQTAASIERGIDYLLQHQNENGTWDEDAYTGTGFPRAFYLRYDLYRIYFPLLVLSQYRASLEEKNG